MPTEHKKSKSKPAVEIKVEGQELHPLGHYIDDRVELIRQIFMSLKSKTIKSIAPDFLQGKSLESIQEYCLDELLGISKKRLQSIINATKCPDNTDSSDSDVENIEEHISLEEISSDSADDALHANKSKAAKRKAKASENKNGTATGTGSGKKEVSVLELLELQARARAIRSQLALEPVTKIELDSDNDSDDSSSSKAKDLSSTAETNKDQAGRSTSTSKSVVEGTNGMQIIKPAVPAVKPVRLKRNFRQRQNEDYDPDEDDEAKSVDNSEVKEADKKSDDEKDEKIADDVKVDEKKPDEQPERSPSPDLIPIVQEPETYCISSDDDEPGSSSVPKYITYPTVVREKLPETEDELFLKKIKEGSGVDLRDLIKARRGEKQTEIEAAVDTSNAVTQSKAETSSKSVENSNEKATEGKTDQQLDKDTEPEEGELTDDDQDEIEINQVTILSSDDDENGETPKKSENEAVNREGAITAENKEDESSSESSSSDNDSDTDSSAAPIFKEADDDDDIIDLGKDEDLDFEVERSEKKIKKLRKTKKKPKIVDVSNEAPREAVADDKVDEKSNEATPEVVADVDVDETTNDNEDANEDANEAVEMTESTDNKDASKEEEPATDADPAESDTWQTRWLRGRNVTKVMATSRLANKVRTKIKQKKSKAEQETANADSNDVPATETVTFGPAVEEGSVQHYEVLIAQENENKNE